MGKELNALFHDLLQEISEQEKKMTVSASEEAMRRAEEIVQNVEEDKSWQIPPEPKKPEIPPPQHAPVVVPPPVSHFTDEPSQNPAVRMRDRLDETALPKPDVERKPTHIFEARPKKNVRKKKRRKKAVHSRPSGRGADMPTPTEKKPETKRKIPHIHIPDELPPDIPRDTSDDMHAPVQKKAETSPRDEMVRSRAEMIREQLRRAAAEEVSRTEQPDEEPNDIPQEVLSDAETLPDASAVSEAVPEEDPVKKTSAFKRFLNVFLDLDSDEEETEAAETDEDDAWDAPQEETWDAPQEETWDEPEEPETDYPEDREEADEDVPDAAPFRKSDAAQPALRNLTNMPEQEVRPSLLSRFRQKRKKAVKKDSDQDEESTPQETDWRTLVAPPSPEVSETTVSDDDDFYADDLYGHKLSDVGRATAIDDEIKAIVQDTLSEELPEITAPPMPPPATPKAPDPETPMMPDPAVPGVPVSETPSVPSSETPEMPVPEPAAPSLTEVSVRRRRSSRLRNLEIFEDEPEETEIPEKAAETTETSQEVQEAEEPEERPVSGKFSAVLREALDESAEELAEMKAEPLPVKGEVGVKTRFLKRHWYFLAGILCFLLALVGLMTCISWGIGKAKQFVGSSSIKQNIEDVLYPVAVVDLPAFETPAELNASDLLSAAMVDILMYDDLSAYPVNFDVISIPANDVLARAQQRFGTEFSVEFATLYAAGETFYYDAASGCYNVTTSPAIFSYAPEVTKLQRSGDTYTASVLCVSDKASWQERSENFRGGSEKEIEVTLQKNGDSYQIQRIVSVGS